MGSGKRHKRVDWRASLALLALALAGCTEDPDIVAYPLGLEAGTLSDAGAKPLDRCLMQERIKQSQLPQELVLDLYFSQDCSIPLEDFVPPDAGERGFSIEQLRRLFDMPRPPAPVPDRSIDSLCEQYPDGQFPQPSKHPDRLVLCPNACKTFKNWISTVLALDGCQDTASDDAGT